MKLIFKKQAFQTRVVEAVVDCFNGQPNTAGIISYRIDSGISKQQKSDAESGQMTLLYGKLMEIVGVGVISSQEVQ